MDLKFVNGSIVTAVDTYRADVGVSKGKISRSPARSRSPPGRSWST
jgi:hypothetical protein